MLTGVYVSTKDLIDLGSSGSLSTKRRGISSHSGTLSSRLRGRGVDLDEVRLYQPGDDSRNIDWKVTARKQKTHTKVFREERERPSLIVVDQGVSMFFGSKHRLKSVAAAESGAILGWDTLRRRDRIGGVVFGNGVPQLFKPVRSKLNLVRFLGELSKQNQELNRDRFKAHPQPTNWEELLWNVRRVAPAGHQISIISDFQDLESTLLHQLLVLQRHNQLTLLYIFDPLEKELPPASRYTVTDGTRKVTFSTTSRTTRQQYTHTFDQRLKDLESLCMARGVRFAAQSTEEQLPSKLLHDA